MDVTKVDQNRFASALGESRFKPVLNWSGMLLVWTGLYEGNAKAYTEGKKEINSASDAVYALPQR